MASELDVHRIRESNYLGVLYWNVPEQVVRERCTEGRVMKSFYPHGYASRRVYVRFICFFLINPTPIPMQGIAVRRFYHSVMLTKETRRVPSMHHLVNSHVLFLSDISTNRSSSTSSSRDPSLHSSHTPASKALNLLSYLPGEWSPNMSLPNLSSPNLPSTSLISLNCTLVAGRPNA